jgi:hypothetical protein
MKNHDLIALDHSKYLEIICDNAPSPVSSLDELMGVKYYGAEFDPSNDKNRIYYFEVVDIKKVILFKIKYGF